ncbi:OmpA family protein [Photobacterium sp. R1]
MRTDSTCSIALLLIFPLLLLNGCSVWPEKGNGGMAEHYPVTLAPVMPDKPLEPEHGLRFELDMVSQHLDILVLEGAEQCFPATVVQAKQNQQRITRELEGGLSYDAANDLIVQRNLLKRLENQLDDVKNKGACHPQTANMQAPAALASKLYQLLNSDNQFAFNSPEVNPKYMGHLAEAAILLRDIPTYRLHITGHADRVGTPEFNQRLALNRAKQVQRYLEIFGLPSTRITIASVGSEDPLFDGHGPEVRLTNRRVSIELVEITRPMPGPMQGKESP